MSHPGFCPAAGSGKIRDIETNVVLPAVVSSLHQKPTGQPVVEVMAGLAMTKATRLGRLRERRLLISRKIKQYYDSL